MSVFKVRGSIYKNDERCSHTLSTIFQKEGLLVLTFCRECMCSLGEVVVLLVFPGKTQASLHCERNLIPYIRTVGMEGKRGLESSLWYSP